MLCFATTLQLGAGKGIYTQPAARESFATHGTSELVQPSPPRLRFDPSILRSSLKPVSSRDGRLVLWRHHGAPEVRICNTFTGRVDALPCIGDAEIKLGNDGIYPPALLSVIGAGDSFELFVMDTCLRRRTFSSESGEWGDLRSVQPPLESCRNHWTMFEPDPHTSATVVGRTVHWLCQPTWTPGTPHGTKLGLVVAEEPAGVISMWTLAPAEGWTRQVVVSVEGISAQVMAPGVDDARPRRGVWHQPGFGERSGAVLFWMDKVGLVRLSVGTKKAVVVLRCGEADASGVQRAFLHEINLVSVLQGMRQF
ncbi:hypothetical protein QOZ80_3AG0213960 [Eleusine coracana subsp. coracana]|nr:hypothetical protein QOZ80_3AG0213960 [Eleusine coracana subsp. coracana]